MKFIKTSAEDFENELLDTKFMNYEDYSEINLLRKLNDDCFCLRCNELREPLTYLDINYYYLPCWDCVGSRKSDRIEGTNNIIRNIKDFYSRILGDRYYQLFIVDDIYRKATLSHEYEVFKNVVNSLNPPSRNDIWFLDWEKGFPKIISKENIDGIKIVNLSKLYSVITTDKSSIKINNYEILYPEFSNYDNKHHSRYSILNISSDRKTKKLRLSEDKCIIFFNNQSNNSKSIFKIKKDGKDINFNEIPYSDFVILKLILMRNKSFLKLIFDIVNEIIKSIGIFRDSVFLKNTIVMDPIKDKKFNLTWIPKEFKEDYINISIF